MLSTYLDILRYRQAWKFSAAGLVLRLPMSMVGLSTILMVRAEYGNYTAGRRCLSRQHHRHGDLRANPRAPR